MVCRQAVLLLLPFTTLICTCLLTAGPCHAAVTERDIQVAARILGFTTNPLTGNVRVGIVYDPANARSKADEQALIGILGPGLVVGGITLIPVPITIENVFNTPANLLFLTAGLGSQAAEVGASARAFKILCMTTEVSATQAGECAVSVQTAPKVQITINRATAAASGITFESAFMLMITEI